MFQNCYPKFNNGKILKTSMLKNIRDYPKDITALICNEHSDGIISGADVYSKKENSIIIEKGIIKHNNRIYILNKNLCLTNIPVNMETVIKIRFLDKS